MALARVKSSLTKPTLQSAWGGNFVLSVHFTKLSVTDNVWTRSCCCVVALCSAFSVSVNHSSIAQEVKNIMWKLHIRSRFFGYCTVTPAFAVWVWFSWQYKKKIYFIFCSQVDPEYCLPTFFFFFFYWLFLVFSRFIKKKRCCLPSSGGNRYTARLRARFFFSSCQ